MSKVITSLRLPVDLKNFVDQEAKRNSSSQNSEIIRCIRERLDRAGREMPAQAGE